MMRGVGDALVELHGDLLYRALPLGEQIDDLGPPSRPERLGDLGEAFEQRVLGARSPTVAILTTHTPSVNPQTIT